MFEKFVRTILDSTLECTYYLVDLETNKIAYISDSGCDLLRIPQDTYRGISCYELLYDRKECCNFCNGDTLAVGDFIESEIKEGAFKSLPFRQSTVLIHQGRKYRLELASRQPQTLPSLYDETPTFDQAMIRSAGALMRDGDINQALLELVQISNSFYCGIQSSLLEIDKKSKMLVQSTYFVPDNYPRKRENLFHGVSSDIFMQWDNQLSLGEVIFITHVSKEVEGDLCKTLRREKITSLILAPIKQNDELSAFIVIQNPMALHIDFRFIRSMTLFLREGLQKRSMLQQIENLNDYDTITGFFNQKKYTEKMDDLLLNPPEMLGIVFVDISQTKNKSQQSNFALEDEHVAQAATVIEPFFKESFYRVQPEKFICFVPNLNKDEFVSKVDSLRIETANHNNISFSVGYTWETEIDNTLRQLHDVDQLISYDPLDDFESDYRVNSKIVQEMSVQKDLLHAIESKEFEIYFQPKVHLKNRKVVGAEALVRRRATSEQGLLYPSIFVQLYEDQAIIRHLDLYVVEEVCKILKLWLDLGVKIPISVNFSQVTLTEYGIVNTICEICNNYQIPHNLLIIEFTERIAMMNEKAYEQIAEDFEKAGFLLSLDDFGAAYSNLITLAKINIDEIKIDKSLVQDMEDDIKNQIVLKGIIQMCNVIDGISPLAEGIETELQAEKLLEYGCIYGQGNLFSPPVSSLRFYQLFLADK